MTKRVESLRAPCLDASSTLATSTSKRRIGFRLFSLRWLGRLTGGGVDDLSACGCRFENKLSKSRK